MKGGAEMSKDLDALPVEPAMVVCARCGLPDNDSLGAIRRLRARLAEEIEARKKADAENRKLVDLLAPFVKLGAGEQLTPPYHDLSDDVVIYSNSGANITVGDVRSAYRAVAVYQTMSRGI